MGSSKNSKEKFIENLKNFFNNENHTVVDEGFFEKNITVPHINSDKKYCEKIKVGGKKWEMKINKSGDYIKVALKNLDVILKTYAHFSAKIIVYIRNISNFNYYKYIVTPFETFDNLHGIKEFNLIKISELYDKSNKNYILESNKCVIGVYIRFYKYEKENFIKQVMMKEPKESNLLVKDGLFEWTIHYSTLLKKPIYSPKFKVGNRECVLKIDSDKDKKDSSSINVNVNIIDLISKSDMKFSKHNRIVFIRKCGDYSCFKYSECNSKNGITFILSNSPKSVDYIFEDNKCIIGVYLRFTYDKKYKFRNLIKNSVKNEQCVPECEGFFEWKIENWNQLSNVESSSEFNIGNHKWKLELYPMGLGENNRNYVSVRLKNTDNTNYLSHICMKKVIYIRNYDDYKYYQFKDDESFSYYNKYCNATDLNIIKHTDLYIERGHNNRSIIENNKCIVGIFIRVYKYKKEQYIDELISSINNENRIIQSNGFYEWKIDNWNCIFYDDFSPIFKIGNFRWKLSLYPNGEKKINKNFVTVKLHNLDIENIDYTYITAKLVFFIRNVSNSCFTMKGLPLFTHFTKHDNCFGVDIIETNCLSNKNMNKSFIENNECIVGVYIRTYKNDEFDYNLNMNHPTESMKINKEKRLSSRRFENDTVVDRKLKGRELHSVQQINHYEELFQKRDIYNNILKEKEKCERELVKMKNYVKELEDKLSKKQNIKTPTLVISKNNFIASEYDQLDIRKNEFLVVTDWNCEEGWVFGHRKDNKEEMGFFPKIFVEIYNEDEKMVIHKNQITPEYRINFEEKIKRLRSLKEMKLIVRDTKISINRNKLFDDSFNTIMKLTLDDMKKTLRIKYIGEVGIDAGGLLRDFFYQLSKEIGNPNYLLLQYSPSNSYELEINPKSSMANPLYLKYFKFIGRVMGLAILNNQHLPLSFTLLFYKKLIGKEPEFSDLKDVDPEMYKNLNWLKKNEGVENLCLTFEIEENDCFGNHKIVNLKPNGANIDVTDENKFEYIDLVAKNKLNNTGDEKQFEAIRKGFYEIIPNKINNILDEFDLKFLLSGMNEIDVDDWQKNTDYEGYDENDVTIINFWKCVKELNDDKKTQLLLFATGNSQVPITGFKDLQGNGKIQHFKLKKAGDEKDFPVSHTCFNRIDLPPYTSYTQLKQKLLRAITEGMTEFQRD